MKIRKVEKNDANYPKADGVSEEEIKKKIPKKFLVLGVLGGAGVIAAAVGLAAYVYSLSTVMSGETAENLDLIQLRETNKQISVYEGDKRRGCEVKDLLNSVDVLNKHGVFPIDVDIIYEERK